MFSLANIISWFTEVLNPTSPEDEQDQTGGMIPSQEGEEFPKDTSIPIEEPIDPKMASDGINFGLLRVSDSEDWDEEISMLQTNTEDTKNTIDRREPKLAEIFGHNNSEQATQENNLHGMNTGASDSIKSKPVCSDTAIMQSGSNESHTSQVSLPVPQVEENNYKMPATTSVPHMVNQQKKISNKYQPLTSKNVAPSLDKRQENINRENIVYEKQFDWEYMEKLTDLESVFSLPEKDQFLVKLRKTLECVPSPYSFLLYLVENYYSNVIEGKNSLAHIALTHFLKWHKNEQFCTSEPTEMEKDRALWIVTTRKLFLFDLCNEVFHLDSKGNEYLQRHIYYLLESKKRYKEAVTIAYKLHLQPCFQPKEILLPLIILNKVQLAESYIADCPYQQRAFVSMLDKLCVMSDENLEALANEIIPTRPQNCKITQASLTKLGERIVKKFQLDPDDFEELFKAKNRNGLSYLLHQRQKDKGKSTKKWDDLIEVGTSSKIFNVHNDVYVMSTTRVFLCAMCERCVGNNLSLQETLVKLLTDYGDKDEAQMWARYYQLPCAQTTHVNDFCEQPVMSSYEHNITRSDSTEQEDWESEIEQPPEFFEKEKHGRWSEGRLSNKTGSLSSESVIENQYLDRPTSTYLELKIPMRRIFFVDDNESLRQCQRAISKPGVTVGFDAEWKPQMCQTGLPQRLSIMQLSLRNQVFILDVIAIAEQVSENVLSSFGNALFANENVLKLGYGVESDFKALITTLPILEKCIKRMKRFVDLCNLGQQLFELPAMKKKIDEQTKSLMSFGHLSEKGLSLLVQQCLGLPLDKTYQLSDWEQRPLLQEQVIYAALDARCLLDVFDVLNKWMREEKIVVDFNECSPRLPWLFPKRRRKPKGKVCKQPKPGSSNCDMQRLNQPALQGSSNSPQNFRVVVDNMLQGLGRYLRCCGVDVVMLANDDGHEKAAKIALREGRVLLTTGTPYYTLRSQVPLGQCMCVPAGSAKEQVLAVFKHFNVSVKTSDIFSRCQLCNGNEYIMVSSILMRQAYMNYHDNKGGINETANQSMSNNQSPSSPLDVNTLVLRSGTKVQIDVLPESILDKVGLFYCCATCGKIFWEGGHFTQICSQFSEVLSNTESFYQITRDNTASTKLTSETS